MNVSNLLKKLTFLGALFGPKAKKLTGIRDFSNVYTGMVTFNAPNKLTFNSIPAFLSVGTQFRVTAGINAGNLYTVKAVSGNTLITLENVQSGTGPATLDGRMATVLNDTNVAKLNSSGNSIFNVEYTGPGSMTMVEHYHGSQSTGGGNGGYGFSFTYIPSATSVLIPEGQAMLTPYLELEIKDGGELILDGEVFFL
jgi:hypothetical protein